MRLPSRPGTLDPELDARLVQRCLDGDPKAWGALVQRHERLVYAVARSWRLGDEDLGDVFQEVFAALVKGLPRMRDGRTLVRWLSSTTDRIARTTALKRRKEQALRGGDDETLTGMSSDDAPIGADLEQLERQATVRLAFGGLSDRCKRLLQALYYEDPVPAYGVLAERLGVPVGSLGPTRARCMDKLRTLLAETAANPPGISGDPAPTSGDGTGGPPEKKRRRPGTTPPSTSGPSSQEEKSE
jgi:RNA polymerase sigma factor (sigma-70 family)